jgi:Protein of unknown function (DUF3089)
VAGTRRIRFAFVAAAVLLLCGAVSASPAGAKTVWLCKPGAADNPCEPGLKTTLFSPAGERLGVRNVKEKERRKVDCFYVYPTVSDDEGTNSDRKIDPEERSIALYQAARYSQYCRVFAPMYRQVTLSALFSGEPISGEAAATAYGDVLRAWRVYLRRHNDGRGIVLLGHSQGTVVLRALAAAEIDGDRGLRRRLVSAILLGGNVLVEEGRDVGGDFKRIPACERADQLGCVIAFSTFDEPVPEDARFGRPTGFFGGDPATRDVLCTNPSALRGGKAPLRTIVPSEPFAPGTTIGFATEATGLPRFDVRTPFVEIVGGYVGRCSSADDADVLQIRPAGGAPDLNPVPDASWGLHLVDANIALGGLVDLVRKQSREFTPRD